MSIYNFAISELQHFVMQPFLLPILRAVNLHVLILKIEHFAIRWVFADPGHICAPHFCHHCGAEVVCLKLGTHGLSCCYSEGRQHRHASINIIIYQALISAQLPSHLEPSGLLRSDGKWPDGMTIVPWKCGPVTCLGCHLHRYLCCIIQGASHN